MHEEEVKTLVDACRSLGADAIILEADGYAIVVAVDGYDGTYAAEVCGPDAPLPSIARGLQLRLRDRSGGRCPEDLLPAAAARAALRQWERQIALVFGGRYAARLIADTCGAETPDGMAGEQLGRVRRRLSAAIGGCIDLRKVDK